MLLAGAAGLAFAFAEAVAADENPLWATARALLSGLLCGGALYLLREGFFRLRGVDGLGLGDVKLGAAGGLWLGWEFFAVAVLIELVRYVESVNRELAGFLSFVAHDDFAASPPLARKGRVFRELESAYQLLAGKYRKLNLQRAANHRFLEALVEPVQLPSLEMYPGEAVVELKGSVERGQRLVLSIECSQHLAAAAVRHRGVGIKLKRRFEVCECGLEVAEDTVCFAAGNQPLNLRAAQLKRPHSTLTRSSGASPPWTKSCAAR